MAVNPALVVAVAQLALSIYKSMTASGGPSLADLLSKQAQMLVMISKQIALLSEKLDLVIDKLNDIHADLLKVPTEVVVLTEIAALRGAVSEYQELITLYEKEQATTDSIKLRELYVPEFQKLGDKIVGATHRLFSFDIPSTVSAIPIVAMSLLVEVQCALFVHPTRREAMKIMMERYKNWFQKVTLNKDQLSPEETLLRFRLEDAKVGMRKVLGIYNTAGQLYTTCIKGLENDRRYGYHTVYTDFRLMHYRFAVTLENSRYEDSEGVAELKAKGYFAVKWPVQGLCDFQNSGGAALKFIESPLVEVAQIEAKEVAQTVGKAVLKGANGVEVGAHVGKPFPGVMAASNPWSYHYSYVPPTLPEYPDHRPSTVSSSFLAEKDWDSVAPLCQRAGKSFISETIASYSQDMKLASSFLVAEMITCASLLDTGREAISYIDQMNAKLQAP